jgi:hypothetical protein
MQTRISEKSTNVFCPDIMEIIKVIKIGKRSKKLIASPVIL